MSNIESKSNFINRWDSDAFPNKEVGYQVFKDVKQKLKISPHPFSSWRSVPNQKLKTITINENGLRSKSLKNLRFKNNAVLLGGSVAWGFGATSNENTPAYLIENILYEKYGIEFNIINLAEQMFTSFEELNSFMATADELKPSLVVSLSGCNDINAAYLNSFKDNSLYKISTNFFLWGIKLGLVHEKNFFKKILKLFFRSYKQNSDFNDDFYSINKPGKKQIATKLFENKLTWMNSYCKSKNIKIIHILQPDLHFKKHKSKFEQSYIDSIEQTRSKFTIDGFRELEKIFFSETPNNSNELYLNLLDIFDKYDNTIYVDKAHTSNGGYKLMAEKICAEIFKNSEFLKK